MEIKFTKNLLKSLLNYKENLTELNKETLMEIVNYKKEIDLYFLENLIYADSKNKSSKKERIREVKNLLNEFFVWCFYKNYETLSLEIPFSKKRKNLSGGVWILRDKDKSNEEELKEILRKEAKARRVKVKIPVKNDSTEEEEILQIINQINKTEEKPEEVKERIEDKIESQEEKKLGPMFKFITKMEKSEQTHSFCPYRVLNHVRRRDDLVNPQKITYINFTNRIKPPTYKIITEKLYNVVDSTQRLPHINDYSVDSDDEWEDCEDAETISSEESIISQEEEVDDWVESDSEIVEKTSKIMSLSEPKLFFITINLPDYSLNIRRRDFLKDEEKEIFKREVKNKKDIRKYIKEFSDHLWIQSEIVKKFSDELKLHE